MRSLLWSDVRGEFEPDGALRDIYVHETNEEDWQRVVDLIRSRGWPARYLSGGETVPMPESMGEIFDAARTEGVFWGITPAPSLQINCHFFTTDGIEFDLDPSEIVGQAELDVVVGFLRAIGDVTGKPSILCYENGPPSAFISYDPRDGRLAAHELE